MIKKALKDQIAKVLSRILQEKSNTPPSDPDMRETNYNRYKIRFKKEVDHWVSYIFPPGKNRPIEERVTATHSEGPEILISRTRRKINELAKVR